MRSSILNHFKKVDPVLYNTTVGGGGLIEINIREYKDYFYALTSSIISQQLSGKAASTIFGRFRKLFPKGEITPERLLKIPNQRLRGVGMSNAKAAFLKDLALKVNQNELDLKKISQMDNEELISELTKVKGIGRWTAEMFLMFSLGRKDVFSLLDLGLKNAIKKLYQIENPTKEQLLEISNKWSPYRTYASLVLWRSLDNS